MLVICFINKKQERISNDLENVLKIITEELKILKMDDFF